MRALAPLPAFLLLAASAAACPFGVPGHFHPKAESAGPAAAMPEGKCTGRGQAPPPAPAPAASPPYDLRANPVPAEHRVYWEMIGFRFDDASARIRDANGNVVTQPAIDDLERPFDASHERLNASLWAAFMLNGYRLDEATCHLIGSDTKPLNSFSMKVWAAVARRGQSHAALENLLAKLRGLNPQLPVPEDIRKAMLDLSKAGTELPPNILALIARNGTTVGQLRGPAAATYADSTSFYDGQRSLLDTVRAVIPQGTEPGVAARRKGITDPDERVLGRTLSTAFNNEMSKTAPGRELLSHFQGAKGAGLPDVMVLKLTQSPNDPNAPGAVYDYSADRMVINHWEVVRVLHARLPADKLAKIGGRLGDAKQLSKLLVEDPSLLPLIVDNIDVIYFHELTHAAQSRRDRLDDELIRGNLPGANPLSKEHEAHRAHCRYLLSKGPAAIDRSDWRDYCLGLIRNPDAFKDSVTSRYLSTFSGSTTLDDVATRQEVRRGTARALEGRGGVVNWFEQKLKQFGFVQGDAALAVYRPDVDKREKEFLADMPRLRREAGEALVNFYEDNGNVNRALALAVTLPAGTLEDSAARLDALTNRTIAWLARGKDPAQLVERLGAVGVLADRLKTEKREWPPEMVEAYDRDARSHCENLLARAIKTPPADIAVRERLLDEAEAWSKAVSNPKDITARIAKARTKK